MLTKAPTDAVRLGMELLSSRDPSARVWKIYLEAVRSVHWNESTLWLDYEDMQNVGG
jgi:hypothetical protein